MWEERWKGKQHRRIGRDHRSGESFGKLEQPLSVTQAPAMAEWEVLMDQSRLLLSRTKAREGTSLDSQAMSEPLLELNK